MSKPPMPGQTGAPTYDGDITKLARFFRTFNFMAEGCSLADAKQKEILSLYVTDPDIADDWDNLPQHAGSASFDDFKKAILALYPAVTQDRLHTEDDLRAIIDPAKAKGIHTLGDYSAFHVSFARVANYLITKDRLTKRETAVLFREAFSAEVLSKIDIKLLIDHPKHHPSEPYTLDQLHAATTFIFTGTSNKLSAANDSANVKKEQSDVSILAAQVGELAGFVRSFITAPAHNRPPQPTQNTSYNSSFATGDLCHGCGKPGERLANCSVIADYIKRGLCKKNDEGRIVLTNGRFIGRDLQGNTLKEKIDDWHRIQGSRQNPPGVTQSAQANLVSVSQARHENPAPSGTTLLHDSSSRIEEVPDETDYQELQRLQVMIEQTKDQFDRLNRRFAGKTKGNSPPPPKPPSATPAREKAPPSQSPPSLPSLPSPIDPAATALLDRAMATQIPVTLGELFTVAPELRKQSKDRLTTKRTAAEKLPAMVETLADPVDVYKAVHKGKGLPMNKEGVKVAPITMPLVSIWPELDNQFQVEGILDSGSSIVGISDQVAARLALPYRTDILLDMESAHGDHKKTTGYIPDLRLSFGTVDFFVQAHIVPGAAYDLLLGLPFSTLTSARLDTPSGGETSVLLRDPNTSVAITVPGVVRGSKDSNDNSEHGKQGF
jgi:gag-polyprotein putative aspartyl protease